MASNKFNLNDQIDDNVLEDIRRGALGQSPAAQGSGFNSVTDSYDNPQTQEFMNRIMAGAVPQMQQAQPAPEMNPVVKDYLMKKMKQPASDSPPEPMMDAQASPQVAAATPNIMDQFSPEKYQEALSQMKEKQSNLGLSQFAAGIGDALARKDSSSTDKYFGDLRNNIQDQTTGEFNRQKVSAVNDIKTKEQLNKLDPNSTESKSFRKLVESTMPNIARTYGDKWDLVTAADGNTILDFGKMREQIDARKQQYEMQAQLKKEARDAKASELSTTRAKQMGLYKNGVAAEEQYLKATSNKNDYDPTGSGQFIDNSDWAPNLLKNNKAIESSASRDAWIESFLRDASGAAIAKSEREAYNKLYFPQPGDTKAVVDNKKALRDEKMRSAAVGAGMSADAPTPQRNTSFPMQLKKNGHVATVNNPKELQEAKSEGWE